MKTIILTVQSANNQWRLGLSKSDSENYFSHLESVKFQLSDELGFECNAACGTSNKKAFDFNNIKLSKWITENHFEIYPRWKPTKLIFMMTFVKKKKVLKFHSKKNNKS